MNLTADEATIFKNYVADTNEFAELCAASINEEGEYDVDDFIAERVTKIVVLALSKAKGLKLDANGNIK